MGPDRVHQLVLGTVPVEPPVGEQDGGGAHAEEAVGDEHGAVVTEVPVEGDVLGADDEGVRVGVHLEEVLGEVDGDEPGAAAHAAQVVAQNVAAELVAVDDHGRERGRGVEEAAVDDEDGHVLGPYVGLGEELVDGTEHDGLRLLAGLSHGRVGRHVEHGLGKVGGVAQPGSLQDLALEL